MGASAILLGIVATARNHRIDVQEYLTWVFERVGTHAPKFAMTSAALTPAAFERAHPQHYHPK